MKYAIRFMVVTAVFLAVEKLSSEVCSYFFKKTWEPAETLIVLPAKSQSRVRVDKRLDITLEEYDTSDDRLISSAPYWNVCLAGMDRQELEEYLADSQNLASDDDYERGYYASEIAVMDRMSLCIRKLYR